MSQHQPVEEEICVPFHAIKLWITVSYIKGDEDWFEVMEITTKNSPADRVLADYFDENLLLIRDAAFKVVLERKKENPAP